MIRGIKVVVIAASAVCVCTSQIAQAQLIRDFDSRTIVNVGPIDVAPCRCVVKPFTFPEFLTADVRRNMNGLLAAMLALGRPDPARIARDQGE